MNKQEGSEEKIYASLDQRVSKLAEDMAAQKTVGELIKYLVYFWAAISAVLGLFGWSKFSDLDKIVESHVIAQLPKEKQEFGRYRDLVMEAETLNKKYKELAKSYEESVAALVHAKTAGAEFDIEGKLTVMIREAKARRNNTHSDDEDAAEISTQTEGTLLDPKWRKDSIATVMLFRDILAKKKFPADFIFNVTQTTRALNQFQLAEELTKAAFAKDPTPPIRALYLSSRVKNSTGAEREKAFQDLLAMVLDLPRNSPEIVLAEAWNAAEEQRRYADYIAVLDRLIEKQPDAPSYVHVIRATSILRQSLPGSVAQAEAGFTKALGLLSAESAHSSWFESTLRELQEGLSVVAKTRMLTEAAKQMRS